MEKLCKILIQTGKNKFIPIGIAKINLEFGMDELSYDDVITKAILKKIDINVKKEDVIWEAYSNVWVSK